MGIGSVIGAGAKIGGGLLGSSAAGRAGDQMSQGNILAAIMQRQMFDQLVGMASPFMSYGQNALDKLAPLIGTNKGGNPLTAPLTKKFNPTMEQLEKTPGYQFTLGQGLQTVQNNAAAKGLGLSGNALRGAADYASGLASQTYQQQFNNYWAENKDIYNMLSGAGNVGMGALGIIGGASPQFANMIGNSIASAGNAQGNATLAGANSLISGISGAYNVFNANQPSWWNTPIRTAAQGFWG